MKMGKSAKTTIIYVLAFALLLGGILIFQAIAPKPVVAKVYFTPDTLDLEAPGWAVKEVIVTIWFKSVKYDGRDIDPKTILFDGVLEPKGGWKHGVWTEREKPDVAWRWVCKVRLAGSTLIDWLWHRIGHEGIPGPSATIPIQVTGNMYDGTAFQGTGYIDVLIPTTVEPNPPPQP